MKQLVILSGKGGTGKTSVVAAFASVASQAEPILPVVLADADVDAANLALVLRPRVVEAHMFLGGSVAVVDPQVCQGCGVCREVCRFDAILPAEREQGVAYRVDPIACEGCAACAFECPERAISLEPQPAGHWFRSDSRYGPLFHAELRPGQDNSGRLVTLVKQRARLHALETGGALLVVDGPPGIGCPAISSLAGADRALIVTEPGVSGDHDMARVLQMAEHFGIPAGVCINKEDLAPEETERIVETASRHHAQIVGRIPFDPMVTRAMVAGDPVTRRAPTAPASKALEATWQRVMDWL
jgi:MinD superfamily P-loop ATPase